jgi:metal-responsive CopG/Arc/MetJ family transcriptional regulator
MIKIIAFKVKRMSESKTISLRIPENILTEIDRIAQEKYKSHKGTPNRSLVILDALEAYIHTSSCDANKEIVASHDDVLIEQVQELEKTVSSLIEDFKQFKESIIAVNDDENKVNDLPDPISNSVEGGLLPRQPDLFAVNDDENKFNEPDSGLTPTELAKRLGKEFGDINSKKYQSYKGKGKPEEFAMWSKKLDPDGWEWEFREEKGKRGKYYPIKPLA